MLRSPEFCIFVGSIIRKYFGELGNNEIVLFVDDDFEDNKGIQLIPAGTFASIYFESFSFYKEKKYADILPNMSKITIKSLAIIYVKWWLNCCFPQAEKCLSFADSYEFPKLSL